MLPVREGETWPPDEVWGWAETALRAAGDTSAVRGVEPVKSGYESRAFRLRTRERTYFLKWSATVKPGRYPAEARGLALLRETKSVRVPEVVAVRDAVGSGAPGEEGEGDGKRVPAVFLMEWLDRPAIEVFLRRTGAGLGRQLAEMHRCGTFWGGAVPGYRSDDGARDGGGFVDEGWSEDWPSHYRDRVLRRYVEESEEKGLMPAERRRRLERLMDRLEGLLGGVERRPSLLHGDLHRGNVLCDAAGAPALVDPGVSFGDRELELAQMEASRWSVFPPVFWAAYFEAWPAAPGREERRDLYVLRQHLRELARGRPEQGMAVDSIAVRYVGT